MNILEGAKVLQDFRSQLDAWGVTPQGLIAVAVIAMFFFIFSAREVVGWFFKTGGLREEIRGLRTEVQRLQIAIEAMEEKRENPDKPTGKISAAGKSGSEDTPTLKSFRLDH